MKNIRKIKLKMKKLFKASDRFLNSSINKIFTSWRFIICLLITIFLLYYFPDKSTQDAELIIRLTGITSAIFSGILIGYLTSFSIQLRREKWDRIPRIAELTQKVHSYRRLLKLLMDETDFWKNDLHSYMQNQYKNITYFDVHELVNSAGYLRANTKKYFDDKNHGNIKQLFLEIRALVGSKSFDRTLMYDFNTLEFYKPSIITKWLEHQCGNGFWFFLIEHKSSFLAKVDFTVFSKENLIYAKTQAKRINKSRFKKFNLNPTDLAEVSEYMIHEVFQNLHLYQQRQLVPFPKEYKTLYLLLSAIILTGVIIPIACLIFGLDKLSIVYLPIFTLGLSIYTILLVYKLMTKEV